MISHDFPIEKRRFVRTPPAEQHTTATARQSPSGAHEQHEEVLSKRFVQRDALTQIHLWPCFPSGDQLEASVFPSWILQDHIQ